MAAAEDNSPENGGREDKPISAVRRHPLIMFFVLTYALTWWAVPFGAFIASGPLVAALGVIPLTQGWARLRELGSRMIRWRVRWYW